jgi:hypothetical protein
MNMIIIIVLLALILGYVAWALYSRRQVKS